MIAFLLMYLCLQNSPIDIVGKCDKLCGDSGVEETPLYGIGTHHESWFIMIYLDYSANTPADSEVLEAFCKTEQTYMGNPNSTHCAGRAAQAEMARATDAVDSELGTVQPIAQIAEILRDWPNCRLHVDATQAVGKTALVLEGVDTMSIAPHKFYGLNGSGLLFKRSGLILKPQIQGGTSTTIYRSGTPALALAVSTEKALELALTHQEERIRHVRELNDRLRAALSRYPNVRINSPESAVPHILNLSVRGVKGTVFQQALSEAGVCVSVKSACSADGMPSKAVFAVSRDRKNALSSWRISLSHLTTHDELERFLQLFDRCYKELAV